jgi:L-fuconate dehydratase
VVVERARYRPPAAPGYSSEMKRESIERYLFPGGAEWAS